MAALLSPRYKLWIHVAEIMLIVPVMIITGVRMTLPGTARTRANTIGLAMGAKSLVFIAYQLLSEHVPAFRRWWSLKAYAIINGLEVVFWGAVAVLTIQANIQVCVATSCILGWVVVAIAIVVNMLCIWAFLVSYLEFRRFRANGNTQVDEISAKRDTSNERAVPRPQPVADYELRHHRHDSHHGHYYKNPVTVV